MVISGFVIDMNTKQETVNLEMAKKLSRYGWCKCQSEVGYQKRAHATVYDKVEGGNKYQRTYDAPNATELRKMCEAIDYEPEEGLPVMLLADKLISHVRRHKIKLPKW